MAKDENKIGDGSVEDGLLVVGVVGKPKGIKGWLRCRSFTDDPADLGEFYVDWRLRDAAGRIGHWRVEDWRPTSEDGVLEVKLEGCDDRNLAMTLTNREILVSRSEFPGIEGEGSYYWVDLIGFTVRNDLTGEDIGVMTGVMEQPAADLIEIEPFDVTREARGGSDEKANPKESQKASAEAEGIPDGIADDEASGDASKERSERSPKNETIDPASREEAGRSRGIRRLRPGREGRSSKNKSSRKTLIPWIWGVFVMDVDMDAKVITVQWREAE